MDWNNITSIPARKNLIPAKRIMSRVPDDSIPNSSYPIFIEGVALPHKKQQSIASRNTAGSVVIQSFFFSIFSFVPPEINVDYRSLCGQSPKGYITIEAVDEQ